MVRTKQCNESDSGFDGDHQTNITVKSVMESDIATSAGATSSQQSDTAVETDDAEVDFIDEFDCPTERLTRDEYIRRGPIRPVLTSYLRSSFSGKLRSFQKQWYESRPWLEYNKTKDAAFCFPCRVFGNPVQRDPKFQVLGYKNWSLALVKGKGFHKHASSEHHASCMERWHMHQLSLPVDAQLIAEQRHRLELGNKERQ